MTPPLVQTLKADIEGYVRYLFSKHQKKELVYHNLEHTEAVVRRALELAANERLSEEDIFILYAAAWFHDTGHLFTAQTRHEEESVQIAGKFFSQYPGVPSVIIAHTERCILSTKMPQVPCTPLEKIICDADTYHFGTAEFLVTNELVKEEVRLGGKDVSGWDASTLKLLQNHTYHTAFCRGKLTPGKAHNMALLRGKSA